MTIILMRVLYGLYFLGAGWVVFNALSTCLFSRRKWRRKISHLVKAVLLAPVWPLAMLSPSGRKVLLKKASEL